MGDLYEEIATEKVNELNQSENLFEDSYTAQDPTEQTVNSKSKKVTFNKETPQLPKIEPKTKRKFPPPPKVSDSEFSGENNSAPADFETESLEDEEQTLEYISVQFLAKYEPSGRPPSILNVKGDKKS